MNDPIPVAEAKRALRREMRAVRLGIDDRHARSSRICAQLIEAMRARSVRRVAVYEAVEGEPDLAEFVQWCRSNAVSVDVVEPDPQAAPPASPGQLDAVIVPGLAFTPEGDRLGQGGGWYDRFLNAVPGRCAIVGVAFDGQLRSSLPIEPHDRPMHAVITETGVAGSTLPA